MPRCGSVQLWGHGFVSAYFDEVPTAIWLRRFRCPDCRAVIRLRPRGCWSRFQAPVETIRPSFSNKLARGRWDLGLLRPRQRHWLQGLLRQGSLYLRLSWSGDLFGRGLRLAQWPEFGYGQPVGATGEPFPFPVPAGADGQRDRPTCRPQAFRGRAANDIWHSDAMHGPMFLVATNGARLTSSPSSTI
ncbi:hypothetical protein DFAR_950002 [Desulfarculales bacterium]